MRRLASFVAVAALFSGLAAPTYAAPKKAAAKAPAKAAPAAGTEHPGTSPEVENAMLYLKVLISGLQSEKVEAPAKGALVGCIYNNSLQKISESMDKIIAEHPGKVHRDNPTELLSAMVALCGYKPATQPAPQGR